MRRLADVAIVGAGPAGLVAGLELAKRGFDVALLEEHDTVGRPVHCTGILAREAFDEFDLSTNAILNDLTTATFVSPSGLEVHHRARDHDVVVVDRAVFDADLATRAGAAGVHLIGGSRVTAVQRDGNGVTVEVLRRPPVRARVAVLATGGRYALHRKLGLGLPAVFLHTAQYEFAAERLGAVELHFGSEIAPKGFGWAVPVARGDRAHVRIGVMAERDAPSHFAKMVDRVARRWGVHAARAAVPRLKFLPLSPIPRTYSNRVLAVGDAAGLVKPTTGGGIYFSLLSGAIAADVVAASLERDSVDASRLAEYERRWRARLQDELDAQLRLRSIAHRMSDDDIDRLFHLARTDGVMPLVRRTASFNRHRKLILALLAHPPARHIFR